MRCVRNAADKDRKPMTPQEPLDDAVDAYHAEVERRQAGNFAQEQEQEPPQVTPEQVEAWEKEHSEDGTTELCLVCSHEGNLVTWPCPTALLIRALKATEGELTAALATAHQIQDRAEAAEARAREVEAANVGLHAAVDSLQATVYGLSDALQAAEETR
jgi:hypothetical protein